MDIVTPRRRRRSRYDALPTWLTWRRAVAAVAAASVLIVGTYGVRLVLSVSHLFHTDPISAVRTLVAGHSDSDVARSARDLRRINIALYGYGGQGHDGAYLTDSIMVVSIQPQASGPARIAEISIPRDWQVPIDLGNGKSAMGRINEAYESGQIGAPFSSDVYSGDHGGGALADATLERMLGIHMDYFVGIDFTAFKDAVDSVGGVDINVQHTFTDNNYPRGECPPDCAVETIHFDAGTQHMDGARALIFSRSRESSDPLEGSNFARNKRQQLVLTAVRQKVLSAGGLRNLPDLVNALGDHVNFDVPLDSALSLYDLVKDVDPASIVHLSIDSSNFIHECGYPMHCNASIEFPFDRTFATVHHFVDTMFVPTDVIAQQTPISVVDAAGQSNAASRRWASLLTTLGLHATDGGTRPRAAVTRVIDHSGGHFAATAQWLASYYGVSVEQPGAVGTPGESAATGAVSSGIEVILGQDEESSFNNPAPGLYRQ
jgi:LCP family protein required for cell wall assembly